MLKPRGQSEAAANAETLEILQELEQSTTDAVKKLRTHARVNIRAKVVIEPGNRSQRSSFRYLGMTGDLSEGGCQVLAPEPLNVGDIYRLVFDGQTIHHPPILAQCLRARQVKDDAFEAGLRFLGKLDLESVLKDPGGETAA